jgi:hypothetical protein
VALTNLNTADFLLGDGVTQDGNVITVTGGGDSYFLGVFASLAALEAAHATAQPGEYAYVDEGIGSDIIQYLWDDDDAQWVAGGAPTTGGGHEIQLDGTPLDQRAAIDVQSDFLNVEDNAGNDSTELDFSDRAKVAHYMTLYNFTR